MPQLQDKPKPPPIPISPEEHNKERKSWRKTLHGLIVPTTPKTAKTPKTPSWAEKMAGFVPLEVGKKERPGRFGLKKPTLVIIWIVGILVILGLTFGLIFGIGVKGLQPNSNSAATASPTPSQTLQSASSGVPVAGMTGSNSTATVSTTATPSATPTAAAKLTVQKFNQPGFAVPADATPFTYTPAAQGATTGIGAIDCPASNGTIYTSGGQKFMKMCYNDFPGPNVLNLNQTTTNSLESCISACHAYNANGVKCRAVSYSADMDSVLPLQHANCWLKDGPGVPKPGVWDQASAVLVP